MDLSLSRHPVGPWLFGKVPAHGDFIARGLDSVLRDSLDDWLSREVAAARDVYGTEFESRFDHAPLVKFVDRDADGRYAGGSLCGSVDAVGRRYPLLAAIPSPDMRTARAAADACESATYMAFTERLDADMLYRRLFEPMVAAGAAAPLESHWWVDSADAGGEIWACPGRFPDGIVTEILRIAL